MMFHLNMFEHVPVSKNLLVASFVFVFVELKVNYKITLFFMYRQGSGSACRSLYGGFVKWIMGKVCSVYIFCFDASNEKGF